MATKAMPIEWHEKNLINRKKSLESLQRLIDNLIADKERSIKEITLLELQINTAKETNKNKFDEERYLVKK